MGKVRERPRGLLLRGVKVLCQVNEAWEVCGGRGVGNSRERWIKRRGEGGAGRGGVT